MRPVQLRPISVEIDAPRSLVFEMAAAVGGALPGAPPHESRLLQRNGDLLTVEYVTPAPLRPLRMVEEVLLTADERIDYRVLSGPLDLVEEHLLFEAIGPRRTQVSYGGQVGSGRWIIGWPLARLVAVPAYDRFMRRTLAALKEAAERRASRSRVHAEPAESMGRA